MMEKRAGAATVSLLGVLLTGAWAERAEAVLCLTPSGTLKVRAECRPRQTEVDPASLGLVGPAGPQGPPGPAGPPGSSPSPLFALVNADGMLDRHQHAVSSQIFSAGEYEVVFDRDVSACGYAASLGFPGDGFSAGPGEIGVTRRLGIPAGLYVTVYDSTGGPASKPFFVSVVCGD